MAQLATSEEASKLQAYWSGLQTKIKSLAVRGERQLRVVRQGPFTPPYLQLLQDNGLVVKADETEPYAYLISW